MKMFLWFTSTFEFFLQKYSLGNAFLLSIIKFTEDGMIRVYDIPLIDPIDFSELIMRFVINLFFAFIIIRLIYFPFNNRNQTQLFTLFLFNTLIFFVCALFRNLPLGIGFAFGLFALFGLLRYRTEPIPIKDLTYLFAVICIGMINAMFSRRISYAEFTGANILITIIAFVIEKILSRKVEHSKLIEYEKINLIKPENYQELLEDLKNRTGLNIHRIHLESINFLRDTARIWVYYYKDKNDKKNKEKK